MIAKPFTVLTLLDMELKGHNSLNLHCIAGRKGLTRVITVPNINRPGLELSGFFDAFTSECVQIFGRGETAFIEKLYKENKVDTVEKLFSYKIPCAVFTHNLLPNSQFLEVAERSGCAVLQTDLESSEFAIRLLRAFSNMFAPKKTLHGVLVEVYGIGILLTGHSGIGKSECALELIERGHRLVADDIVEIRCVNGNTILGQGANNFISHHMEIRGLGIINVTQLYGVGSIREQKEVQIIIKLEEWDQNKIYDRVGTNLSTTEFLGVKIPTIEIPVRPGRNLPIIIEAAAMNERLKYMGYNSARDFNQNILKWIESTDAQNSYYGFDDSY
ncbi:HPr(Ser) kinase/phosphatase [Treponema pectinovorum]|uniref:HPr(Ser) kinase/phosphatase n=1 Tax=Treponema pectinovorum TaxID=164 RepID=UPI0011CB655E|nr:HPr(Ser) kinase/phosphatase [Treponema pectinovorum]